METFKDIPRNVEEAIKQILSSWSVEEKESYKELKPFDLLNLSNTLGSDIRNTFSLWYGNPELLKDCELYEKLNKEFYTKVYEMQKEQEKQLKEEIEALNDFDLVDILENNKEQPENLTEEGMDPYLASQIIIFAVWKHLQDVTPYI